MIISTNLTLNKPYMYVFNNIYLTKIKNCHSIFHRS